MYNTLIQILIPTYNRAPFLKKNLRLLESQINSSELSNKISILISDNASIDDTYEVVHKFLDISSIKVQYFRQDNNIGLEPNVIFLLKRASSDFVMTLGDDDYLPEGYLEFLIEKIEKEEDLTCVIPGFSALYSDGRKCIARTANFKRKKYNPGFISTLQLAQFGHQLSGLTFTRKGLYTRYVNSGYRNIYPFVFFAGWNILRGYTWYVPEYQVLVSQDNSKDWKYDDAGLLPAFLKNVNILFPKSLYKRFLLSYSIMWKQQWRLRISRKVNLAFKSMIFLMKTHSVDLLTKIFLPLLYFLVYVNKLRLTLKRNLKQVRFHSE
jgi:glycosyltransferase involved in cell wall biosynthesis